MYIYVEVDPEIFGLCRYIFQTNKRTVKEIFIVDEMLLWIDGQDFWLWIAHEPHLNICLMMLIYQEKTNDFLLLQVLQTPEIYGMMKTSLY